MKRRNKRNCNNNEITSVTSVTINGRTIFKKEKTISSGETDYTNFTMYGSSRRRRWW